MPTTRSCRGCFRLRKAVRAELASVGLPAGAALRCRGVDTAGKRSDYNYLEDWVSAAGDLLYSSKALGISACSCSIRVPCDG